jgi:hypothetical protein
LLSDGGGEGESPPAARTGVTKGITISAIENIASVKSLISPILVTSFSFGW